jgi:hypothetical protein
MNFTMVFIRPPLNAAAHDAGRPICWNRSLRGPAEADARR